MQSSLSKAELNARRAGDVLIIECLDPRALSEVLVELVAREPEAPKALLVDMSRVEMIRGEGLEAIMQLREQSAEQGVVLGLIRVSFYIEQLLAVLEMSEQMPARYASLEEAGASLSAQNIKLAEGALEPVLAGAAATQADLSDSGSGDFQFELEAASRAETQRMSALPAQALLPAGAEDLLAVNFSDYQRPRKSPSEEGFEISLDGELAFADTDKFTGKDLRAASSGVMANRTTEVLPAFTELDSDSDADSDIDIVDAFDDNDETAVGDAHVGDGELVSGLDSLLAVDFDDYGSTAGSDRDTPPEGVAAKDSNEFQIEFDEDDLVATKREPVLPFPAAPKTSGYSPVGSLPTSARPPLPETKVFDPTQLGVGARSGGLSESLSYMETQELAVPKGLLGELESADDSADDSDDGNQDAIATQVMQAVRPKFPIGSGPAAPPPPPAPILPMGSGGFLAADDDDQGTMMAPASFMAGAGGAGFYEGDGEETMLLNVNSLNLAAHLAALDVAATQMTGGQVPAGPSAAERAQAERQRTEGEKAERERLNEDRRSLDAERRQLEELAAAREAERKQLEELAAVREAERLRYEAELKRAQEEERRKLEAELHLLRERERERLEAEMKRAQEEERKRFEEELRKAQEEERERLRIELEQAREATRKQMEEELRKAQEAERKRLEEETRLVQEAERKRLEEELRRVQDEERQRLAEEARRVQEAERKRLEEELRRAQDEERRRLAEEARRLQEENERKAREEAERLARAEAERLIEAERQARVEAERLIEAERQARAEAERKVEAERLARVSAERAADLAAAQQAALEAEAKARAARAKVEAAKSEAARAASASESNRSRRGGKTKFRDWFKKLGPGEGSSNASLRGRRGEIRSFCEAKGILSPLAVKLLGILQSFRNKALGEEELARQVESKEREVAGALGTLVSKRLVRRTRAARLANGYGFKIAGSPKDRNQVAALLELTENGQVWPIKS